LKYNCPFCDFTIEGDSKIAKQIVEHDKTHPENSAEGCEYKGITEIGTKPKCSWCGCDQDHGD